jgi:4-hydroxybenzoate polyprenyltransferase
LWAYLKTRFPAWLAILLPLVLVLAALRERVSLSVQFAAAFGMAVLLVLEFRLWDDLSDVERDRHVHPQRALCRSASLRPFWGLVFLLMAFNFCLAMLVRGWWAAAMLLGLHILLAAWYAWRERARWRPVANYHVVLLKYPLIVWMLGAITAADIGDPPLLCSAAMVYLSLCIYEVAHDGQLRQLRAARICLAVESVLLAAVGCWALLSLEWLRFWP